MSNEQKESTGVKPKYKGDGVAVWENTDKNGNPYLSIKILGSVIVKAFPLKEE